jgi:hypothetical protein
MALQPFENMTKTRLMDFPVMLAVVWRTIAVVLLLCGSMPVLAQRSNLEGIVDAGHGTSRSWVDVNNDGRDDYCVFVGGDAQTLQCYLWTGNGFNATPMTVSVGSWDKLRHWWIDVNGDGLVDLCRVMDTLAGGTVTVQCRFGPSFGTSQQATLPATESASSQAGVYDVRDLNFVDVNLDGTSDLCFMYRSTSGSYDIRCVLFAGTTFGTVPTAAGRVLTIGDRDWARGFYDVNGDGYPDYCGQSGGYIRCALNSKNGFVAGANYDSGSLASPTQHANGSTFVDINGDGNTDFCRLTEPVSGSFRLSCRLSTGKGWDTADRSTSQYIQKGDAENRWWIDINGDGLPDFCRANGADPDQGSKRSSLWCLLARGGDSVNGMFGVSELVFESGVTDAIDFGNYGGGRSFCDAFGTGIQTLCRATYREVATGTTDCYEGESAPVCYPVYNSMNGIAVGVYGGLVGAVPTPDAIQASPSLLAAYTDGLGAETRITYMPMSSPHVYAKSGPGTEFPRVQVAQPRSAAVFETRAWRTGSTTLTLTGNARYFYKDLRTDSQAGSRGFRERWFLTEGSNTLEHTTYYQGRGPTVDTESLLHDAREIGQVKERRVYAIDTPKVRENLPGWTPPAGATPRQRKLSATMYQAQSVPASMSTSAVSPTTQDNPFMLLKRTVNTLGHTSNDAGTADNPHPRLRPVILTTTQSWDWTGTTAVALPSASNAIKTTYYGNVVRLDESTTDGSQVWSKQTTNTYAQDSIPNWLLGRLTSTTVVSTAPTADSQLATTPSAYGGSPNANTSSSNAAPLITLSPPSFGNVQVGQNSTANATLTNGGTSPTVIVVPGAASVSGSGMSFVSTTCATPLAAGGSCTVAVRFAPASVTTTTGTVSVDTAGGVRVAAFTATSLATYSASTLISAAPALGTVTWGDAAPTATISLRNDGNSPMTLTGLSGLASRFQITANTCSGVAASASCTMTLSMPTTASLGTDTNNVMTIGATSNASFAVSGTVRGVASRWSPAALAFGNVNVGQSGTQNVTLTNEGFGINANWTSAASSLANLPAGFAADTSACGAVAPGTSCTVPVTFAPTAAQSYSGSNITPTNQSYAGNTLSVSGTGVYPRTTLTPNPANLGFGTLKKESYKTLSLTLTNSGTAAATNLNYALASLGTAGRYSRTQGTCPATGGTLAAGGNCTLTVSYDSYCTGGSVPGTLTISSPNLASALVVNLTAATSSTGVCQ